MSNVTKNTYLPDYLVTPGEVLLDFLEGLNITQAELSDRTGLTRKTINGIIKAKEPISSETALKLERTLGRSAQYWSNLERNYQGDKVRLAEKMRMEAQLHWLDNFPINEMAKLGWIQKTKDKVEQLEILLRFFGIASPNQWVTFWGNLEVNYRQTTKQEKSVEAISAWLRQGEIEAKQIKCALYDSKRLLENIDKIRALTMEKDPEIFIPALVDLCSGTGVVVVFVPALKKIGCHGSTRWIGDKPVIQLSFYLKSNDQFWFTFFHEIGHILKHGRKDFFLEGTQQENKKEEEANAFARDKLIPPVQLKKFLQDHKPPALTDIGHFAREIGIAPGIVVGRLQREGILSWKIGNHFKVYYEWEKHEVRS
ncbi:HigA family addiction module antitoxin [Treponema primitia]|uniref:HigA family addiction module antitoxin n=1 Tax=Treponema primitia TaxID=88058 RepID=UPI003980D577